MKGSPGGAGAAGQAVRVGIAGTGAMAGYHVRKFSSIPGVRVTACSGRRPDETAAFAGRLGIPLWFASSSELAASGEVDCVATAVADAAHARAALDALERRLPVFAEKPLARTVREAESMCEAAARAGVPAFVNFSKRNAPALSLARSLVAEGRIGRITGADFSYQQSWLIQDSWGRWQEEPRWRWRVSPGTSTEGALGDLGSHLFDAIRFILGELAAASCSMTRFTADPDEPSRAGAPDSFLATLSLESGALVCARGSWRAAGHLDDLSFVVYGDAGSLSVDLSVSRGTVTLLPQEASRPSKAPCELTAHPVASTYTLFIEAVRGATPRGPLFADGAAVQRVIEACAGSAREGKKTLAI